MAAVRGCVHRASAAVGARGRQSHVAHKAPKGRVRAAGRDKPATQAGNAQPAQGAAGTCAPWCVVWALGAGRQRCATASARAASASALLSGGRARTRLCVWSCTRCARRLTSSQRSRAAAAAATLCTAAPRRRRTAHGARRDVAEDTSLDSLGLGKKKKKKKKFHELHFRRTVLTKSQLAACTASAVLRAALLAASAAADDPATCFPCVIEAPKSHRQQRESTTTTAAHRASGSAGVPHAASVGVSSVQAHLLPSTQWLEAAIAAQACHA